MKIKIRSDDASTLRKDGWSQTGDWPAELRDDSRTEPPGDGQSKADGADVPRSGALAQADALTEARARAHADAQARAQADARAQARAHAEADACAGAIGRAVIGDQLRIPIMWCDMGSCISVHADPASLGEADARARAISVGWRIDALGRLACPRCQQTDPSFWASLQVVPWDRYMAIARTTRTAVPGDGTANSVAGGTSHNPGRAASGYPPASRAEREWHHYAPNTHAMPAGRYAENPAGTLIRAAWPWNTVRARQPRQASDSSPPCQTPRNCAPVPMAR